MSTRKCAAICAVISILVALLQFMPFFLGLDIFGDDMTFYWRVIRRDFFLSKSFWYDKLLNGTSFLTNPLYGLFYLPNFLYLLFPEPITIRIFLLLHYAILGAGIGVWGRLNHQLPSRIFVATSLLTASGVMLSMIYRGIPFLVAVCWLPWIAAAANDAARKKTLLPFAVAGGLTGIGLCSGDIQMLAYGPLLTLIAYFSYHDGPRLSLAFDLRTSPLRALTACFVFACGVLATSILTLIYSFELWKISPRASGLSTREALTFSFHPLRLIEFSWNIFGKVGTPEFSGQHYTSSLYGNVWWYPNLSFGPLALIIFATGLWQTLKYRRYRGYMGLGALMLMWSFGRWNPVVTWIVEHISLARSVRYPAKVLLPACIVVLPVIWRGLDAVFQRFESAKSRYRLLLMFIGLAGLIVPPLAQEPNFIYLPKGWDQPFPWVDKLQIVPDDAAPARLVVDPAMTALSYAESSLSTAGSLAWGIRSFFSPEASAMPVDLSYLTRDDFAAASARENFGFNFLLTGHSLSPILDSACKQGSLICYTVGERDHLTLLHPHKWPRRWALVPYWQRGEIEEMLQTQAVAPALAPDQLYVSRKRFLTTRGFIATDSYAEVFDAPSREAQPCAAVDTPHFDHDQGVAKFRIKANCSNVLAVNFRFLPGWRAKLDRQ